MWTMVWEAWPLTGVPECVSDEWQECFTCRHIVRNKLILKVVEFLSVIVSFLGLVLTILHWYKMTCSILKMNCMDCTVYLSLFISISVSCISLTLMIPIFSVFSFINSLYIPLFIYGMLFCLYLFLLIPILIWSHQFSTLMSGLFYEGSCWKVRFYLSISIHIYLPLYISHFISIPVC